MSSVKRTFFVRYWWLFAGVLSAVALSTALNISNTDGWVVVTNSSSEDWVVDWNTSRPTVCSLGNYSRWTGTGFVCAPDVSGSGADYSAEIASLNSTKLNITDQRYNDTTAINTVSTLAQAKAFASSVDCGSGNFLRVLTINNGSWSTTCASDQSGGGLTETINYTTTQYATTSNTVYVNMNNLTTTLSASSRYTVECNFITFSAIVTTGEQLRVNTTGTPTTVTWTYNSQVSATTRTSYQGVNTATNAFADTGSAGTNVRDNTQLWGYIATGANPVTVTYEMKSEISTSNAAYDEGSICRYTKVA